MGSITSHIADMEEEERWKKHRERETHKAKCKEAWDRYLAGDGKGSVDFPKVLEYARDLETEVKTLRQQVEFADQLRSRLKMFLGK